MTAVTAPATGAVPRRARPLLRGWIHAAACPLALVGAWVLWESSAGASALQRTSVVVFGAMLVGLFSVSALYHIPRWTERRRWLLSRLDVVMIQLFITASFTPFATHALDGAWRTASLAVAWTIGLVGAVVAASPVTGPRWLVASAYVAFGSMAVVPVWKIAHALPWQGTGLIVLSGALYIVGAVVYARRRPDPWPHRFGYHEVFHVLVVLAGAAHFVALLRYALPLA